MNNNINEKLPLTAYTFLFRVTIILLDLNYYVVTHKYIVEEKSFILHSVLSRKFNNQVKETLNTSLTFCMTCKHTKLKVIFAVHE